MMYELFWGLVQGSSCKKLHTSIAAHYCSSFSVRLLLWTCSLGYDPIFDMNVPIIRMVKITEYIAVKSILLQLYLLYCRWLDYWRFQICFVSEKILRSVLVCYNLRYFLEELCCGSLVIWDLESQQLLLQYHIESEASICWLCSAVKGKNESYLWGLYS